MLAVYLISSYFYTFIWLIRHCFFLDTFYSVPSINCCSFAVCLTDSVLAFHEHGMQGRSFKNGEITQEIIDNSRVFRLLGSDRYVMTRVFKHPCCKNCCWEQNFFEFYPNSCVMKRITALNFINPRSWSKLELPIVAASPLLSSAIVSPLQEKAFPNVLYLYDVSPAPVNVTFHLSTWLSVCPDFYNLWAAPLLLFCQSVITSAHDDVPNHSLFLIAIVFPIPWCSLPASHVTSSIFFYRFMFSRFFAFSRSFVRHQEVSEPHYYVCRDTLIEPFSL